MTQVMQHTMRAAAIDAFGGPITLHELPMPQIGPHEILLQVKSAGVGVWDPFERDGGFAKITGMKPRFPHVLGSDGAGIIAEVGSDVHDFKQGDLIYAFGMMDSKGFYAEYTAVDADNASIIPNNVPLEQAGALPYDAMTALRGLDNHLRMQSGESVLIFGASGGIGHIAVQLAKRMGLRVLAVASGYDGAALVRRLGADVTIDGHKDDIAAAAKLFAPNGLDAALFAAGGEAATQAAQMIRQGGRIAYPHGVEPVPSVRSDVRAIAYDGTPSRDAIEKLNSLIEMAPFEVHIDRAFSLEQAADAHEALNTHFLGKLVILPGT